MPFFLILCSMKLAKAVALVGLVLIALGVALGIALIGQEVWEQKSEILASGKVKVYASIGEWTVTLTYPLLMSPKNYRNLVVRGYVEEVSGRPFDLTIEPYVIVRGVSRYEFKFSPKPDEVRKGLTMTIANKAKEKATEDFVVETVVVYGLSKSHWWFKVPLLKRGILVRVNGTATETSGHPFNLYFLGKENFERWRAGLPFDAYFAGTGRSSYIFGFAIPPEKSNEVVYYVVERVGESGLKAPELRVFIDSEKTYEKPVDIEVRYRVEMSWEERSYAHVLVGLVLGGGLAFLGALLLVAAALLRFVFKK